MAVKNLVPERITYAIAPKLSIEVENASELDLSEVVVPYNIAHYLLDDYRILNGWPVSVPKYDVRQVAFASGAGEVVSSRPHPASVATKADVRWIPTEETWDGTALAWHPEDGPYPGYVWRTSVDFSPTFIDDYAYRAGKEVITRSALNFQSDNEEHLWSNFTSGFGALGFYTVIMVLSLESRFGTDGVDLDWSGIFSAGHPTPDDDEEFAEVVTGGNTNLQLRGRYLWVGGAELGFQQAFPINLALTRNQPSYLAFTVEPPVTKVYMGFGVPSMQKAQLTTGAQEPSNLNWVVGRATGDILHCADMTLFDMSLYGSPLTDNELLGEIATLSQAYGG